MIGAFLAAVLVVVDGDTFKARVPVWDGVEITTAVRLRGIDTPEIHGKCQAEKDKAQLAKKRLTELLAGGQAELRDIQPDKFAGRVDADVVVAGVLVSTVLVNEGLARPYLGGARQGWCP